MALARDPTALYEPSVFAEGRDARGVEAAASTTQEYPIAAQQGDGMLMSVGMMRPMEAATFPPLDISPYWESIQEHLLRIVDLVPDDKFNWSPKEDLWNFRGILIHVADARDGWLADGHHGVEDGEPYPNIWATARTRDDLRRELVRSFDRVRRFLQNRSQLDGSYSETWDGQTLVHTGHWIAFHLLEHDIHHRAELLQRLALLDIPHGIDI
jgi:uncharacterized damage-inducible protein DinB